MDKTVYLTGLLVMLVDLLLIVSTDKLFCTSGGWISRAVAALTGGCHAALCLLPGFAFLCADLWRWILLVAAGCIAFDFKIGRIATFCVLNVALETFISAISSGDYWKAILSVSVIFAVYLIFAQRNPVNHHYVKIRVHTNAGPVEMIALRDTGNTLSDPITGRPVVVVSSQMGSRLLGVQESELSHPITVMQKVKGCRLIPYNTVGGRGLLLAKSFENVEIDSRKQRALIAFSPNEIGNGKNFNALTGGIMA